jgi:DNA modification methylase
MRLEMPDFVENSKLKDITSDEELKVYLRNAYSEGFHNGSEDGYDNGIETGKDRGWDVGYNDGARETREDWECKTKSFENWFKHVYGEMRNTDPIADLCSMLKDVSNGPFYLEKMFNELSFTFRKKIGFVE